MSVVTTFCIFISTYILTFLFRRPVHFSIYLLYIFPSHYYDASCHYLRYLPMLQTTTFCIFISTYILTFLFRWPVHFSIYLLYVFHLHYYDVSCHYLSYLYLCCRWRPYAFLSLPTYWPFYFDDLFTFLSTYFTYSRYITMMLVVTTYDIYLCCRRRPFAFLSLPTYWPFYFDDLFTFLSTYFTYSRYTTYLV